jgi:Leu/Phe-tRNA-protein transferase
MGIMTDVDDATFAPLATANQNPSLGQIEILQAQMSHLFDPQPTTQHQHKDGTIPQASDDFKESLHLFIF